MFGSVSADYRGPLGVAAGCTDGTIAELHRRLRWQGRQGRCKGSEASRRMLSLDNSRGTSDSLPTSFALRSVVHHDYLIQGDGHGGFRVRITDSAGKQTVVPNFSTWQEASEWTEEQLRLEREATSSVTVSRCNHTREA
jgi:hypothetical protein